MSDDRCVHGHGVPGLTVTSEIVRYDRAGRWYIEWSDGSRLRLSLDQAAGMASHRDAKAFLGLPGGSRFDAAVRRKRIGGPNA